MFFTKLPLLLATSLFSLAVGGGSPSAAASGRDGSKTRPTDASKRGDKASRGGSEALCARIGCTDTQRTELATIRTETREQLRGARGEGDELRAALAKAMLDDDLTASEASAALATRDDAAVARRDIMAGALVKVHDVLDAKQREQLAAIVQKHGAKAVLGGHHGKAAGHGKDKTKTNAKAKAKAKRGGPDEVEGRRKAGGERRKGAKPGQSANR